MKQLNPKNRKSGTEKTTSNNENNKKQTTIVKEDTKKLLSPKASARERTQCNEERAIQIQHAKRSIKPNCQPTSNSIEKMDSSRRTFEKHSVPEEDYRLFSCGSSRD
jgi:predicted ATP-binding protein involved in virulence